MKDGQGRYQTTVLLGGTSEIGQAIIRSIGLAPGGRVVLAGRSTTVMDGLPAEVSCEAADYDALAPETHDALIDSLANKYGDLDLVIAAAGVLGSQEMHDNDTMAAVRTMQANYVGNVSALIAAARQMKAQGHGTIVVISSVAGLRGRASNYLYGSTKAGLDAFASGMADALVGTGVNVVIVRPGFVHSRMTKGMKSAPQSTTPEAVGQVVAAALKAGKTDVYAPSTLGVMFLVLRNLPRAIFRKLPA
jgi:decaprenylphospho-beta-D-erythro-pentofuranosid-2-ulose 2-reductase